MAKAAKEEVEILSPEIVEEINQKIETSLVKENVTDKVISKLREYLTLTINGQEDKEGFLAVQEARKSAKRLRVLAENICKAGRAEANAISKAWIAKQNEVTSQISEVEDALQKMEDDYIAEKERKKALEAQRLAQQNIERTQHMVSFGARIEDGNWVLGDVSYESVLVSQCDSDIYKGIYDQYKAVFDEKENVKQEEADRQRQAQEKLLKDQQEVERQRKEAIKIRTDGRIAILRSLGLTRSKVEDAYNFERVYVSDKDIEEKDEQDWESIIAGAREGVEKAKEAAEKVEKEKKLFADRLLRLKEWSTNGHYVYAMGGTWGTVEDMVNKTDEDFEEMVNDNNAYLNKIHRQKELQRQRELDDARLEGVGKSRRQLLKAVSGDSGLSNLELGSVPDEQWDNELKIVTGLHNLHQKQLQDKEERERQELLGEKQKYAELVAALKAIPIPDVKSGQYRPKVNVIKSFIEGLK